MENKVKVGWIFELGGLLAVVFVALLLAVWFQTLRPSTPAPTRVVIVSPTATETGRATVTPAAPPAAATATATRAVPSRTLAPTGTAVVISPPATAVPTLATVGAGPLAIVTVAPGDTLSHLALWYYGRAVLWPRICAENGLARCDLIFPGEGLVIPKRN